MVRLQLYSLSMLLLVGEGCRLQGSAEPRRGCERCLGLWLHLRQKRLLHRQAGAGHMVIIHNDL